MRSWKPSWFCIYRRLLRRLPRMTSLQLHVPQCLFTIRETLSAMVYEHILYSLDEGALTITLNRPEVLNAFNSKMGLELLDALKKAERDPAVRAVVLTGAGRGFSSGEDLKAREAEGTVGFGTVLRDRY